MGSGKEDNRARGKGARMRGLVEGYSQGLLERGLPAMRVTCFGLEPSRYHREQARSHRESGGRKTSP